MNNFFDQYLKGHFFQETLYYQYPCYQIMETEVKCFSFISMIKLHSIIDPVQTRVVNRIRHSRLISRVIVLGYWELENFQ